MTSIEHLVEQVGAAGVEAEVAKLVDEQQIRRTPREQASMQRVPRLCGDEVVDEVGGGDESNAESAQARKHTNRIRKVRLADARAADEDAIGLVANEIERRGALDDVSVDLRRIVEVECVETRDRKDPRTTQRNLRAPRSRQATLQTPGTHEECR